MKTLETDILPAGPFRTIRNRLTGLLRMIHALGMHRYPDFVYGKPPFHDFPVFTFHRVRRVLLQNRLDYLRLNGYETVQTDALSPAPTDSGRFSGKRVLLTFDDGTEDLYRIAFPLLREGGMRAVAFISPFWVGRPGVVSWGQIREMHESGAIDFQSHSHSHRMIEVRPGIVDFYRPVMDRLLPWDLPFVPPAEEHVPFRRPPYGTPILPFTSGLSDARAFVKDPEFDRFFLSEVESLGGASFFEQSGWRKRLLSRAERSERSGRRETEAEQYRRIRAELEASRSEMEAHLPGKKVRAFAYPNHVQGRTASALLSELGYSLVFGGIEPDIGSGDSGRSYRYFKRVSADFIPCLPGEGSRNLIRVMLDKYSQKKQDGSL